MKFLKKLLSFEFIALIIITVLAVFGLLNNQYFSIHDDQHIARLYLLDQAIRQGVLYPRWVGGLGFNFGYPLFNFYPPLIYYVAEFFHLIGFNLLWSLKLMIITGSFISSFGMYLLGKRFFDKKTGLLVATLFTFFFYRAITVYIRGAWAEFFAMSILPFVFLGLDNIYRNNSFKRSLLFSISLGLLILAHPLIAFPTFFFVGLFFIYYFYNSENRLIFLGNFLQGVFFGLGLSAFFWLPSIIEKQYTLVDAILTHELANYKIHFIYPFQLWFSPWGYGGSIEGPTDGMSFQLGKIHIFLTIFSLVISMFYFISKKNKELLKLYCFLFFLLLFSIFMSLTYSQFIWDKVKYLWYLQFPWRFLTFTGIFISLVSAAGIYYLGKLIEADSGSKKALFNLFIIIIIFITVIKYITYSKPHDLKSYDEKQLTSFEEISWRVSKTSFEFSPKGIKTKKTELGTTTIGLEKKDLTKDAYSVISADKKGIRIKTILDLFVKKEFKINSKKPFQFRLNTFNFPGWKAILDGKEIKINNNNDYKLITVSVPEGSHKLSFIFKNTLVRNIGNIISFITNIFI
ncbi:MAG: 6-pyruvoyl-tetrahydropterin synthase-related protein, partial [Patescibacteria group bacterium]